MRGWRVWMAVAALALARVSDSATVRADDEPDPPDLRLVHTFRTDTRGIVFPVALSPDERRLAINRADGSLCLYDAATGKPVATFRPPAGRGAGEFSGAVFSPDGSTLATTLGNAVVLLDAATGRIRHHLDHDAYVYVWTYSPDGKMLATVGGASCGVRLWDTTSGREVRRIRLRVPLGGKVVDPFARRQQLDPSECLMAVFSPDGQTLAVSVNDGSIRLCDPATGKELRRFAHPDDRNCRLWCLAFSPDGHFLVAAGPQCYHSGRLWQVATGRALWAFGVPNGESPPGLGKAEQRGWRCMARPQTQGSVILLAFSPDGKALATACADRIRLWEVASGGVRCEASPPPGSVLALSPLGLLVTETSRLLERDTVQLWECAWRRGGEAPPSRPTPDSDEQLWADLASEDAAAGYRAVRALRVRPRHAIGLFGSRLRSVRPEEVAAAGQLIAQLGDDRFATRERASRRLAELGDFARPALRRGLADRPTAESRQRAQRLLTRLDGPAPYREQLRVLRAVEVLEAIGTADARDVLRRLSEGLDGADAGAALGRLGERGDGTPR